MLTRKDDFVKSLIALNPSKAISIGFALVILTGALLLSFPVSSKSGEGIRFIDALFTATSATCVTGLNVIDTNSSYTLFGQTVILLLIQIGGLGIMTIATLFSFAFRRTITVRERLSMVESFGQDALAGIVRLTKHVLIGTLTFEALGALILSTQFIGEYGVALGIYKGIFHSVSAFCNAGFDILGTGFNAVSLTGYVNNTTVNLTIMALIIIGGLGFVVWEDIYKSSSFKKLTFYTKMVLFITAILLIGGAILFFIFEYNNPETLGNLTPKGKFLATLFQSVTPRTAGFESIHQGNLTGPSKLLTIILMFIGGSAGSTAGGIKTVTFGVLVITVISVIRGRSEVSVMKRGISSSTVFKAISVFIIGITIVIVGTIIISSVQGFNILDTLFEMTSAFGTVGLSTGITSSLNTISKIIIILTMYAGRIGVLTLSIALILRNDKSANAYKFPNERIII